MQNVSSSVHRAVYLFFVILCYSCGKYPLNQRGFTSMQQGMMYYCNDDLQMGFEFFGNERPADSLKRLALNTTEKGLLKINAVDKAQQYLFASSSPHGNIRSLLYIPKKQKLSPDYLEYGKDSLAFWYKADTYRGLKYLNALYSKDQHQYGLLTYYDTTDRAHQFLKNQFEAESLVLIARSVRGLHNGRFKCECEVAWIFKETFTSCDERNFLTANTLSNKIKSFSDPTDQYLFKSQLALHYCFAGQHNLALQTFQSLPVPFKRPQKIKKDLPQVQLVNHLKETDSLVLINSLPMFAKHRYWLGIQLQDLYHKGYRYLALDALLPKHSINQLGFAITSDGTQMIDPSYGNLVRQAHRIGYTLIGLDSLEISDKCHVLKQLMAQKAKVLYLSETKTASAVLSTYIPNYIDIDQVSGEYIPNSISKEGVFLLSSNSNELSLVNKLTHFDPCFSLFPLSTVEVSIPIADIDKHLPVKTTDQWAICIYVTNELQTKIASVPIYVQIAQQPISHFNVLLSKGAYTVKVKNKFGVTIHQQELFL